MADRPHLGAVTPEYRARVFAARDVVLKALAAADIRSDVGLTALALIVAHTAIREGVTFAQVLALLASHWGAMNGQPSSNTEVLEAMRQAGFLPDAPATGRPN